MAWNFSYGIGQGEERAVTLSNIWRVMWMPNDIFTRSLINYEIELKNNKIPEIL